MKALRHLHLVGATSGLRTAVYDGRDHLVVDVVAMVEGVVWAVNSEFPEFVPAEELAETPQQWNGRACFAGHPADGATQVTANTPRTLETSFGTIFDAAPREQILATRRLTLSAWLDPEKAAAVGDAAVDIVRRLKAGEVVEVSVGCYIEAEQADGVWQEKPYVGIWRNIVSDHLAFLAEGERGACSVEAGCGAPRSAVRHLVSATGISTEGAMAELKVVAKDVISAKSIAATTRSLRERLLSFWRGRDAQEGMGDRELKYKLWDALRAVEPGFQDIEDIYQDAGEVVYHVMPEDEWYMKRRGYTVDAAGDVMLARTVVRVEPKTTYEVVAAVAAAAQDQTQPELIAAAASCGCGAQDQPSAPKEGTMKDAVKKIIAESNGKYTDADAPWLDAVPDARLEALAVKADAPAAPAADPQPEPKAAEAAPFDWQKVAPKAVLDRFAAMQAQDDAEKTQLIAGIRAAGEAFTEDELKAKDLAELRKLSALAKVEAAVDFTLGGAGRAAAAGSDYAPPDGYAAAMKTASGSTATH